MRTAVVGVVLLGLVGALAPAASATEVDRSGFRYQRSLTPSARGPLMLEPDGPIFAHARADLGDLRIIDARGRQVPWRSFPEIEGARASFTPALDSGRRGGYAVALFDLGPERAVRDRIELEIPDRDFVGRAVVLGADDRAGPFTRLSSTEIYDLQGGEGPARSTVAVFPRSDFRYLMVRATGVSRITRARVSGTPVTPPLITRQPRAITREERDSHTVVTLDLGYENLPVDELRITAGTPRYERAVVVLGSNDGRSFAPVAVGRVSSYPGSSSAPIPIEARYRYLRITIENGDDPPLVGARVEASSRSRALLVERSGPGPLAVLYGNPSEPPPDYDYARLPTHALAVPAVREGRLGAERPNSSFEPPPDTRSFTAKHPGLIAAALALAALALGGVGLVALRSRPRAAT
jgi:hypothetical protein